MAQATQTATPAGRALRWLGGEAVTPPVCLQTYLGLYLAAPRKRDRAGVYRELLGDQQEVSLSFEDVLQAELEAWSRTWSLLRRPPAWMPAPFGGSRAATDGTRIARDGDRLLCQAPGGGVTDLSAPHDPAVRDVWDRRAQAATDPDPEKLVPLLRAQDLLADGQTELTRRALARWGDRHLLTGAMGTPYWIGYSLLGFAGLMETMRRDPARLLALVERALRNQLERVRFQAGCGLRCLFLEECLSSSDLISEADYLEFCYPSTRALLQGARDAGLRTVYYFCGGIEDRLEHLAALPADALAFEESKKDFVIDLREVRRVVGSERPLLGNLDVTLLRDGDAGTVREAVTEQYRRAGPLLAMSCGSPVTLDTPPDKLDLLVEATEACSQL